MDFILSRPTLKIAQEVIDFQPKDFKLELVTFFEKLINQDMGSDREAAAVLKKMIFDRFGLQFRIYTDSMLAAVLPFYSNKNHIFIHKFFRGDFSIPEQDKLLKESVGKKAWIDQKKAKVGGLFSDNVNQLYMNFQQQIRVFKLTPAEMAAVCLHEIGHAFYACEYADRLESMNQVLADIAKIKTSPDKSKKVTYIYHEVKKLNQEMTEEDVDLLLGDNKVIAGAKWFKLVVGAVGSQMGQSKYDETAFEQLADNFASRMGLGRELITALDKIHVLHGAPEKSAVTRFTLVFFDVLQFALLSFYIFIGSVGGIFFMGLLVLLGMLINGENTRDYTYDQVKIRYMRIKHQLITELKNANMSPLDQKAVLEELELVDEILENTTPYQSVFGSIANFFIPSNRKAKKSITEQQLLEQLASNELFVNAAKFKTL